MILTPFRWPADRKRAAAAILWGLDLSSATGQIGRMMSITDAAFCAMARALDQNGGESLAFQMFRETHPDATEEAFTQAIEANVHSAVGRLERLPQRSGSGEIVGREAIQMTPKGRADRQRLCPPQ